MCVSWVRAIRSRHSFCRAVCFLIKRCPARLRPGQMIGSSNRRHASSSRGCMSSGDIEGILCQACGQLADNEIDSAYCQSYNFAAHNGWTTSGAGEILRLRKQGDQAVGHCLTTATCFCTSPGPLNHYRRRRTSWKKKTRTMRGPGAVISCAALSVRPWLLASPH
jgi:hypothetical protein